MKYAKLIRDKDLICGKAHDCEWCGEEIRKDTMCYFRFYKGEGPSMSEWMHLECKAALYSMTEKDWENLNWEWTPGDFKRGVKSLARVSVRSLK